MPRHILIVSPFLPWPADFGGAQRVYHLAAGLTEHADVTIIAPISADQFDDARQLGQQFDLTLVPAGQTARQAAGPAKRIQQLRAIATGQPSIARSYPIQAVHDAIQRNLRIKPIDLIQVEFPQMMLALPAHRPPVVLDAHNIEHLLIRRVAQTTPSTSQEIFNRLDWRPLRRLEHRAWRTADLTIATSHTDAKIIEQITQTPTPTIPNGVDLQRFAGHRGSGTGNREPDPDIPDVLFVAAMRHQPNADGAIWLARSVFPLVQRQIPNARLTLAGVDPPPAVRALSSPAIEVTGRVDDVLPYLQRSSAVAVPLFAGSGTRLKILEAMAAGRPVVSTSIGAEGIEAPPGEAILIADDPEIFAQSLIELITNRESAARIATAARAFVEAQHGWPSIVDRLVVEHDALLKEEA